MAGMAKFAVVDVETTGFSPSSGDRVVELAIVGVDGNAEVEWAWSTLVNPRRHTGPCRVHGVTSAMVEGAPTFDRIAGYAAHLMRGRIPVAHNADFDARFLDAEYARTGWRIPLDRSNYLCTLRLAAQELPYGQRGLASCCEAFGIRNASPHAALGDAMATAELLRALLANPRVCMPRPLPASRWPAIPIFETTGLPREQALVLSA